MFSKITYFCMLLSLFLITCSPLCLFTLLPFFTLVHLFPFFFKKLKHVKPFFLFNTFFYCCTFSHLYPFFFSSFYLVALLPCCLLLPLFFQLFLTFLTFYTTLHNVT